ncbi:MAG: metal ABC transporter solute-binding protein, Zn/Mn family [Methanoculleaceae archaeon]
MAGNGDDVGDDRIQAVVSILPQKEWVEAVGGDHVAVTVLIPEGANPATFDPGPETITRISSADVYFAVGSPLPFESRYLPGFRDANPDMIVVNTSSGIRYLDNDPHVWLSLSNAAAMVNATAKGLSLVDPEHADEYLRNAYEYLARLRETRRSVMEMFSGCERRTFLVYHPAWRYFAEEFGLHQMAIEKEGKEPGALELADIIARAREEGIDTVFIEPQFSARTAEAVAGQLGGSVEVLDPLPEEYCSGILEAAGRIRESLSDG